MMHILREIKFHHVSKDPRRMPNCADYDQPASLSNEGLHYLHRQFCCNILSQFSIQSRSFHIILIHSMLAETFIALSTNKTKPYRTKR